MELTATAVHWDNFKEVVSSGMLTDILFEEIEYEKELLFADTPWPSDSAQAYIIVADELRTLTEAGEGMKSIADNLINEDFSLPHELNIEVDPEQISGSISPASVDRFQATFNQLDLSGLSSPVSEYLAQWGRLFEFASSRRAGIYFHLG